MKIRLGELKRIVREEFTLTEVKKHLDWAALQAQLPKAANEWRELARHEQDEMSDEEIEELCASSYFVHSTKSGRLVGDGIVEFTTYEWSGSTWDEKD